MVSPADFDAARKRAVTLAERTSLGVGGPAELWFEPATPEEVGAVVSACATRGVPLRVLGGGFNLLVGDTPILGAVLATSRLRGLTVHDDRVEAGAGQSFPDLVRRSIELKIPVLAGCPGIPGNVGGIVFMNAGGRFGWVSQALVEVQGVDAAGQPFRRAVSERDFAYRWSPFSGCVITGAAFRRDPGLDAQVLKTDNLAAWAWKKRTQPLGARSAGCIFKNPDGPMGARPAGRLIDEAGLKGLSVGGAKISEVHGNFIVNTGRATAADVIALIDRVRGEVEARHGVRLELEVCRW